MELLTPVPSVSVRAANSGPLPGSALLTPRFSTRPSPALAGTRLRLERPGLTPQEALAGVACGSTGACAGERGLGLKEGRGCSDGRPSQCPWRQCPLCPSWSPCSEGASLSAGTSPLLQLPSPRGAGPFAVPLFFFSFFHPTQVHGDFSGPFRCPSCSADAL